ncbi:hypothetical protein [Emticicia sp. 17c]|uniref:hypothetical protein n=1 Tax=Emticicia sp. 17c TaxID=3127704 RepID=UPI00301C100D
MANYKKGDPVYPKEGANANIYIPAIQKDVQNGGFYASAISMGGYSDNIAASTTEGEMIKYYQVKNRLDKPDYNNPDISFGTFTGITREFQGVLYHNINWNHEWFTHGFLGFNPELNTETITNAYVKDGDVQSISKTQKDADKKTTDDKEFQKYLDDLVNNNNDKKTTGSNTGIVSSTTNVLLGLVIVTVVSLISFGIYKKLKNKKK